MNIFIIIAIFIAIYAFINYRKAFLAFVIFGLFLNQNINMVNIPGVPLLTLNTAMIVVFLFIYWINKRKIKIDATSFPLKKAFWFSTISYIVSMIFSIAGIENSITAVIKYILEECLFVWLIWIIVKDVSDVKFIIKWLTITFLFIGIYALYETLTHSNPIADYEVFIAGKGERILDWVYDEDTNRGYRVKSVFLHAIGAGINFTMFGLFIGYLFQRYKSLYKISTFCILVALLSIACIFLTNSRGPIIFLLIGLIPFINLKSKYLYRAIIALLAILFYYKDHITPYLTNIISIFDSKVSEQVGGSNLSMRLDQLDASFSLLYLSPLWGLGPKAYGFITNDFIMQRLLGLESIWLGIIIERGLLGIASYIYLMYTLIRKLGRNNKLVLYFSLAFLATSTATSTPGTLKYLFYLIIIILIKSQKWQNRSSESERTL